MATKKCEVCGAEFEPKSDKSRACSRTCINRLISAERKAAHMKHKECAICGAAFSIGAKDWQRETCSAECGYKLRASKTSKRQKRKCLTCGKEFEAKRSQMKSYESGGSYCSKICMYERNKAVTHRACLHCGKKFVASPSVSSLMCSISCAYRYYTGSRNHRYLGVTHTVVVNGKKVSRRTKFAYSQRNTERRLASERATPKWANLVAIREIYEACEKITKDTGVVHHVDHIVPLTSKIVCGLHNEFNLMVLPALDNIKKGNRHWPDMP